MQKIHATLPVLAGLVQNIAKRPLALGASFLLAVIHPLPSASAQHLPSHLPITSVSVGEYGTEMSVTYNDADDTSGWFKYCFTGGLKPGAAEKGPYVHEDYPETDWFLDGWCSSSYECRIMDKNGYPYDKSKWTFVALVQFYTGWDRAIVYHKYGPHYYIPVDYDSTWFHPGVLLHGYSAGDPGDYPCYLCY